MHRTDTRLIIFVLAFLSFLGGTHLLVRNFYESDLSVPDQALVVSEWSGTKKNAPLKIEIKSANISAPIVPVGLTRQGAMESPEGPVNTGWFSLGVSPGELGSAVIAGHKGFRTGPAVFDNLHLVSPGDEITVTTAENKNLVFVVKDIKIYDANDKAGEVWNKTDGVYLNLITCSGKWSRLTGTSEQRLVVFTELQK